MKHHPADRGGQTGAVGTTPGVDAELLHWAFWEQRGRGGVVQFTHAELADRLQISRSAAQQLATRMVSEGRLAKMTTQGRYRVIDPSTYSAAGVSPGG